MEVEAAITPHLYSRIRNNKTIMESRSNRHFFDGIQALRLVTALLVVATHATFYTHERLDPGSPAWRADATGVGVFSIIIGFVMIATSAKLAEFRDGWKTLAHRRLLQILPIYWLVTFLVAASFVPVLIERPSIRRLKRRTTPPLRSRLP